jgi:hypothetical protein
MFYPAHFALSRDGSIIAAGEFEKKVHIYDIGKYHKISEFQTILSYGGKRLALSHEGSLCIAATFYRHGIACYSTMDGSTLWQRKDVKKVQEIAVSSDGKRLYCDVNIQTCTVLDIQTGETVEKIRRAKMVYDSKYNPVQFHIGKKKHAIKNMETDEVFSIKKETFALLHSAFGPDQLCLSESTGAVRCISTKDGLEIWRYKPPEGNHILGLIYSENDKYFYGIEWPFKKGGESILLRFGNSKYKADDILSIKSKAVFIFVPNLNVLVMSNGMIIDLKKGKIIREFVFE